MMKIKLYPKSRPKKFELKIGITTTIGDYTDAKMERLAKSILRQVEKSKWKPVHSKQAKP